MSGHKIFNVLQPSNTKHTNLKRCA
ncbi:hypothetical protein Godav_011235 [Gossypium davidsonii]|uniref:Uncharacterized protein n=1 Tax=Gossypium davidsonii TaxID=34287 RepID=A0A7J8R987_GOSDV|nr:hypothetical protein [Gossypium davidsonii]